MEPFQYTVRPYNGISPTIDPSVFLADGVRIVGDVEIGKDSSIWYNTVIRGDVQIVRIGNQTNVQDNCMLHVTHDTHPLHIGNGVTVGHSVILHGCTVEDFVLVGMGAIVLDGAVLEHHSFVAAGAVVTPNTRVPSGYLVGGIPAKVLRPLTPADMMALEESAARYRQYAVQSQKG
ncbi:MAG: gamma carbonic anhydrase family protein [Spirochaetales bacterium]|nr:gamma carbonic anhydrase family protein [Spirochaetales bacterium]